LRGARAYFQLFGLTFALIHLSRLVISTGRASVRTSTY